MRFVHPEGLPYFVLNDEFDFVVVTEANIDDTQIAARILDYSQLANNELQFYNIKVPLRCELFLELGQDHLSCNYYFVDHLAKGLFWLEDIGSELLGIPATMSPSHLGVFCLADVFPMSHPRTEKALERQYWVHVEFFPMHHNSRGQEFSQIVDDLYNIISHGQAGKPFTAVQCRWAG